MIFDKDEKNQASKPESGIQSYMNSIQGLSEKQTPLITSTKRKFEIPDIEDIEDINEMKVNSLKQIPNIPNNPNENMNVSYNFNKINQMNISINIGKNEQLSPNSISKQQYSNYNTLKKKEKYSNYYGGENLLQNKRKAYNSLVEEIGSSLNKKACYSSINPSSNKKDLHISSDYSYNRNRNRELHRDDSKDRRRNNAHIHFRERDNRNNREYQQWNNREREGYGRFKIRDNIESRSERDINNSRLGDKRKICKSTKEAELDLELDNQKSQMNRDNQANNDRLDNLAKLDKVNKIY